MKDKTKKRSKYLSLILRHKPELIGITLDSAGWTDIDKLLVALKSKHDIGWSLDILKNVVKNNNKQRFSISYDGKRIRANQGHSVKVDLGYEESVPPTYLYHGTSANFLDSIYKDGLQKMNRHHVHLSKDINTAELVGRRKGANLIILRVKSEDMYKDGYIFYLSENGVWLTDHVPSRYFDIYGGTGE